jgi:O-antigen ligase
VNRVAADFLSRDPRRAPSSPRDNLPAIPAWLICTAALVAALVVGRFIADGRIKYGLAIVVGSIYVPLVFFDLAAGLALWVAVLFFQDLSVLSFGPNAMGVLVALGWIGALLSRRGMVPALRQHRGLLLMVALFCLWLSLTIAWADRAGPAAQESGYWWLAALAFVIVLTSLHTARDVRVVALAFVIGAVGSVLIGLASGGLTANVDSVGQTAVQGRFTGGGGDPNVQAAGYVAAMFLTIGLLSVYRRAAARAWLLLAFMLVTIGFIATQSRGGLVALVIATIAALILSPRQRGRILGLVAVAGVAVVVLLAVQPGALSRIVDLGGGSSGRSDLWTVAGDVFSGHPIVGVGAGNFVVVEATYVLQPGSISRIQYLTSVPHLVHNTYLQLLAETGIVGCALFLMVIAGCLRTGWRAIKRFEDEGQVEYAEVTRAVLTGTVGMLTTLIFISDGDDLRLWVLLALLPVLGTLASQTRPSERLAVGAPVEPRGSP